MSLTLTLTLSVSTDASNTYLISDDTNTYTISEITTNSFTENTNASYTFNGTINSKSTSFLVEFDASNSSQFFFSFYVQNSLFFNNITSIYQNSSNNTVYIPIEQGNNGFTNNTLIQNSSTSWTFTNEDTMSYLDSDNVLTFISNSETNVNYENVCIIGTMSGLSYLQKTELSDTQNSELIAAVSLIAYSYYNYPQSPIPWITNETTLQYKSPGSYYVIKGFSLTSTQYIASLYATTSYYDFGYYIYDGTTYYTHYQNGTSSTSTGNNGNSSITLNTYYLMENIILSIQNNGSGSIDSPYTAPQIRIPVCADYWLNGTDSSPGNNNPPTINESTPPYDTIPGQTNVSFTSNEYQQFIIDFIYYCYTTWSAANSTTPITFTIDLHWNYVAQIAETSGSYPATTTGTPVSYSTLSSNQLPFSGVALNDMSGGSSGLTLTDNTIAFWSSVASLFGVDANGNAIGSPSAYTYTGGSPTSYFTKSSTTTPLPLSLLQNIMFELYNEPFTDKLTYPDGGTSYSNNYSYYVNGGSTTWNDVSYNFTGFGQMYNTIRQTVGAQNICIVGASDNYAYMDFNTTSDNGQWITSTNSINTNTYNCFTTLSNAITSGTIYKNSSDISQGYFSSTNFNNVLLNFHAYVGLDSGGYTHPGYYDESYYSTTPNNTTTSGQPIAGFAQIVSGLQTTGLSFSMNYPIICTEYGGYDLPWSTYSTTPSTDATSYRYSSDYFSNGLTVDLVGISNYGTPYYNGNYVDASGTSIAYPGIVGFLTDFKNFNISFCAFSARPNSGGNGEIIESSSASYSANSWLLSNLNPSYPTWNQDTNAWAAYSPDVLCGSANAYINFQNGESATTPPALPIPTVPSAALYLSLISYSNQDLSSNTINYGANGADFQYILDNFYNA